MNDTQSCLQRKRELDFEEHDAAPKAADRQDLFVHLHFLTFKFSLPDSQFHSMLGWFKEIAPIEFYTARQATLGIERYDLSFSSQDGSVRGGYSFDESEDVTDGYVMLSGRYWDGFDSISQFRIIKRLRDEFAIAPTRIDLAISDYGGNYIRQSDFEEAIESDNYGGFESSQIIQNRKRGKGVTNFTRYLGCRNSDKFARIYSHDGTPRFEAEMKGKYAKSSFNILCDIEVGDQAEDEIAQEFQQTIGRLAMGGFKFVDRKSKTDKTNLETHLNRCPNLPFWQALIDRMGQPIKIYRGSASESNVSKRIRWLYRQVVLALKETKALASATGINYKKLMGLMSKQANKRWGRKNNFSVSSYKAQLKAMELPEFTSEAILQKIFPEWFDRALEFQCS